MNAETPTPAPGQVWADNDSRCENRTIRIDEVAGGFVVATATVTDWTGQTRSRRTRIRVDRLRPTSTGYRYLRTESTQDGDTP